MPSVCARVCLFLPFRNVLMAQWDLEHHLAMRIVYMNLIQVHLLWKVNRARKKKYEKNKSIHLYIDFNHMDFLHSQRLTITEKSRKIKCEKKRKHTHYTQVVSHNCEVLWLRLWFCFVWWMLRDDFLKENEKWSHIKKTLSCWINWNCMYSFDSIASKRFEMIYTVTMGEGVCSCFGCFKMTISLLTVLLSETLFLSQPHSIEFRWNSQQKTFWRISDAHQSTCAHIMKNLIKKSLKNIDKPTLNRTHIRAIASISPF